MKCPVDDTVLAISERQGIEIDYCPQCRGVWLDRGELDKLLERADDYDRDRDAGRDRDSDRSPDRDRGSDRPREFDRAPDRDRGDDRPRESEHGGYRKKKKSSFLGEFFEFGD